MHVVAEGEGQREIGSEYNRVDDKVADLDETLPRQREPDQVGEDDDGSEEVRARDALGQAPSHFLELRLTPSGRTHGQRIRPGHPKLLRDIGHPPLEQGPVRYPDTVPP
jgi:hypothetical protein